jgi:hypothetical protein
MPAEQDEHWRKLANEFHMMMGYCVAAWAQVDNELYRIFRDCVALHDHAAIIYYRTPGLNVRLDLVDEIVKTTLLPSWERPGTRDPRIKAWKAATKDFRDLLSVRRRIAHHPVAPRQEPRHFGDTLGQLAPSWYEIYVGRHERLRDSAAKLPALRIGDLRMHRLEVAELSIRLESFYHDVLTKPREASPPPDLQSHPPNPLEKGRAGIPRRRRRSSPP